MKHAVTRFRKRRKQEIVKIFGGECSICGYNKCVNALQFHHTDPTLKTKAPTSIIHESSLDKAIKKLQVEKVIMVCANCHAEIHSEEYNCELQNSIREIIQSECKQCKKRFYQLDRNNRTQKYCSHECAQISSRKVAERPTKEELLELVNKFNFTQVGRMFGVSDNAIRKWLK